MISRYIAYIVTPSPNSVGHLVSIHIASPNDRDSGGSLCLLGSVETFEKGIEYIKTLNKEHLLEVS